MVKSKQFGECPGASVRVTETDIIDGFNKVRVNWSTCGELPISEAMKFYNDLGEALGYARIEATRLGLRLED